MKKIKIFLGSSITEFEQERNDLELFIRNISDEFENRYNIKVLPLRCENMDNYIRSDGTKSAINEELVLGSDMCFFIFFTKAGEFTEEEFKVAFEKFKKDGKPKIYIYFKNITDGQTVEESVYDFMSKIDNELKHYHGSFDHIDTIKLRILLNLKIQEMDFVSVEFDNGKCVVDGKETLDLSNVSEFANSDILQQLQKELAEVEEQYFQMKPIYVKGNVSDAFYKEYANIASKRQNIIDSIEELQKNIFNMSLRICKYEVHGDITIRQKEAYRLFELGDYEGAMSVLDAEEINNDFFRKRKLLQEMQKKESQRFIREHKTAIDILMTMVNYKNRFENIEQRYEIIVPIAEEDLVELEVIYDYASFLYDQNNHKKSYRVAKRLKSIYQINPSNFTDYDMACLYNLLGLVCDNVKEEEVYYLQAIKIKEKLAVKNPERYFQNLAVSYNNVGAFYHKLGNAEKAEAYYIRSIKTFEKLASENPERYNCDLARSYNNAGMFYNEQGKVEMAAAYILQAMEIFEDLASDNPERYNSDLATNYNNAGIFYKNWGKAEIAEAYFINAIQIRKKLASKNPERYNPDLATSYINTGVFYDDQGNAEKPEAYYIKAIKIFEKLASKNPKRYNPDLAQCYSIAGVFYYELGENEKAEAYYMRSIKTFEKLASENPERYNPDLAIAYNNAGMFYYEQDSIEKVETYYNEAIRIFEELADEKPRKYNPDLAVSYYVMSFFFKKKTILLKQTACLRKHMT